MGFRPPASSDFGCKFRPLPSDIEQSRILHDMAQQSPILADLERQIMREKETACYEEFAAVIRKHFPGIHITGVQLEARVQELLAAEAKLQENDCGPGCARYPRCEYNHGRHGIIRRNCPLWRAKG